MAPYLSIHACVGHMPLSVSLGVVRAYQQVTETCLVRPDSSVVRASGICLDGPVFNSQSGCLFCLTPFAHCLSQARTQLIYFFTYLFARYLYRHKDKRNIFSVFNSSTSCFALNYE